MTELSNRKNTRLKYYDYSQYGFYFVTICIKQRREFFSKIIDGNLTLTKYGEIVDSIWNQLGDFYNVEIDEYVIMPDHFHGIVVLNGNNTNKNSHSIDNSLSSIIGKFKSYATRKIRECLPPDEKFEWQKSFYDRIIRDENELYFIRKYIQQNPLNWEIEKNNRENLEM